MLEKLLSLFTFYKIMDFSELDAVVSNGAPHQLAKIVEQAHRHERFSTFPPITVSGEMRGRLMYPLTQQQVLDIAATTYPVTENDFRYELREYSQQHNLLRATVIVNIDYHDTAKGIELHHRDVPLYITCSVRPGHGFEIVAVDYENRD